MRPNWFLAFPLDGAFVEQIPKPPSALRRFHPEDVHMTLAFLGGCGQAAAEQAWAALEAQLAQTPLSSFEVNLAEVVPMGAKGRYTALSALLSSGRETATAALAHYRDALMDAANVRRDKRPPKPHITLARPKARATDADRAAGLAWAATLDLSPVHQRLNRIALYTWHDRRLERLFRIVAERPLA
jgi:RNA 2',3'-cyclic 3'-phosphodiesterase